MPRLVGAHRRQNGRIVPCGDHWLIVLLEDCCGFSRFYNNFVWASGSAFISPCALPAISTPPDVFPTPPAPPPRSRPPPPCCPARRLPAWFLESADAPLHKPA